MSTATAAAPLVFHPLFTTSDRKVQVAAVLASRDLPDGPPEELQLVVSTSHSADRKEFLSIVRRQTSRTEGGFRIEAWSVMADSVTLARTPVARYSRKAMEAANAAAVEAVLRSVAQEGSPIGRLARPRFTGGDI